MNRVDFPLDKQVVVALLLIVGMYLPSSTDGEHSRFWVFTLFAILLGLVGYLGWNVGVLPKAVAGVTLPILIVLVGCTLMAMVRGTSEFDFGMFVKFVALAVVLSLDLRRLQPGRLVYRTFVAANCVNMALGMGVLIGSDWATEFVTKYYWAFTPGLVASMVSLHKPVLSFGSHSVAAFFLYLFFWANWEEYKQRRSNLSLVFTFGNFALLLGLTSFTSMGLGALALIQVGYWLWGQHRRYVVIGLLGLVVPLLLLAHVVVDEAAELQEVRVFAPEVFLNSDLSGPLARYGPTGELRLAMNYVYSHPWSPIGLTVGPSAKMEDIWTPSQFFIGDSGPVEYLLRGSVPLLFLIYFGLYRFLRRNLMSRSHAWGVFFAILLFELGFSVLSYPRIYYLLPFFVIYLNGVASRSVSRSTLGTVGADPPHVISSILANPTLPGVRGGAASSFVPEV